MTCPSTEQLLDFLDGSLERASSEILRAHLTDCPLCRGRREALASSDAELPSGLRIGRYVLLRLIGRGSAGAVYEAVDPALERKVAVKLLRSDRAVDAHAGELEARLLREAHALARLAHPNVVSIYDVGQSVRGVFIAMERIRGVTLTRWLEERPQTWQDVLELYLQAGRGLAAAHASGVVHRDFKPDNVLVGEPRRAYVTDFGLARLDPVVTAIEVDDVDFDAPAPLSETGALLGSPRYMSPEQMLGQEANAQSDIFSFSVSLWASLYRTQPFAGRSLRRLRDAKLEGRIEFPPSAIRNMVPAGICESLLRGLQASPRARPPTMDELLAVLEAERVRDGLSRAQQILKEADGFFRPDEKTRAVSTLAVSLLEGALGGEAPSLVTFDRPDLPVLGRVEILGQRLIALLGGLQPYRQLASFVFSREGLPTGPDGTLQLEPDAWYPFWPIVRFAHRGALTLGEGAAFDLARVWAKVTLERHSDLRSEPLPDAFAAIGDRLARDYKVDGVLLDRSPLRRSAVGLWTGALDADGSILVTSSDPFVCATDRGFFTQVLQEFAPGAGLAHEPGPCRDQGGQECRYRIRPCQLVSSVDSSG